MSTQLLSQAQLPPPGTMSYSPPSKSSLDRSGRVAHVYLDESNFKISGATAYKESHRIDPEVRLDWHYDILALNGIIRRVTGMKVNEEVFLSVYGSNLERGLVFGDLKLHSSRLLNIHRKRKHSEKKIDTTLVRDMSLDAVHLQESKETDVLVLVSGDNDMIPAVQYAQECGYTVHVCAWEDSVSDEYKQLACEGLIRLTLLDESLVTLTMPNFSFPMGKLRFPYNCLELLNPWHVVGQLGDKLEEYFHRVRKLKLDS
ncbi:hypothetical protein FAGAP_2741 [Fusarium agapanthi]|uniref:NYN domain-containing protein n=1 Tax=Fusarium agapanthi TaxID=1803897 RepID=A0A9P5EFP1_9HYPO|nr:hypothetical protein FAGAP_2741 [Fusarium agapanthi]